MSKQSTKKRWDDMSEDFFKFPSTPHLTVLGTADVRDDKVLSPAERDDFLTHELVVEEKVDGANLGISFDESGNLRCQNRGDYLYYPYIGQWKKLPEWLEPKIDILFDTLGDRYILFGEWCHAQQSVSYNKLPNWFLAFDVYDKEKNKFVPYLKRNAICQGLRLSEVPFLKCAHFSLEILNKMLSTSVLGDSPAEGIYIRYDEGDWLGGRAKAVRPEFIQSQEMHWSRRGIKANRLSIKASVSDNMGED
jgi:ATP-dependent RNA circularization protein (DNA/RNA ligase family)